MEKNNHNLDIIDLAKFILSIFIMTIHIKTGLPTVVHDFLSNGIARVAVPFFFITSGYLYFKKKDSLTNKSILKTLKRIFLFFLGWTIIYGIYFFFKQYINVENPLVREWMFLRRHIFLNPYGHLWFLPALMIGLTLSYIFYKLHLRITSYITAILLYIIGVFGDTYYYLAIKNDYIKSFFDVYLHYFTNFRNGLFFGFAFISLNQLFSKRTLQQLIFITLSSFITLYVEYFIVKENKLAKDHNMYFSLLILAPSLFQ
ncbi:MAG: acyltransferase, partial [Bacteroidetes bacterium]|nr:acyltransferase [Bacteroidota bacterium]